MQDIRPETHVVLRWSAYEHDHVERGNDWYWALGIAALAIALTSVLFHNILFALVILLAAATIALLSKQPPTLMQFELSERGIRVGDTMHRFEDIISFWVDDERTDRPLLLVDTTKFMAPNLIIPIEHLDPRVVRAYLRERTKEVPMREPFPHRLLESLGL